MARPKEFDPAEAMREAMDAFWERGYHGTSVSDLLAEMGLNRGSLYGTFGDKKQLFLKVLDEYSKQGRRILEAALDKPGPAKAVLLDWIREVAEMCTGEAGLRGCLALKAAMEMAPHDKEVSDWVKHATRERELMVAKLVRRGQAEGGVNADLDPRAVARYLITSLTGLKVLGTAAPSDRDVREVLRLIVRVLE